MGQTAALTITKRPPRPSKHRFVVTPKTPSECGVCGRHRFVNDGLGGAVDTHPLGEVNVEDTVVPPEEGD